ncbi:MAG: c-type cytochrome domain-containing protein [Saprospiraceae bacterium]
MKKERLFKEITLIIMVVLVMGGFDQCVKDGVNVGKLDRSFKGVPDSTHFSPFYDITTVSSGDITPDVNDKIETKGVQSLIKEYCGVSTCHGGPIDPKLSTYAEIRKYTVAGSPEQSKLWNLITTNDLDEAMPPIHAGHELSITDKTILYNWIKNGAKEIPGLEDFRPSAIQLISNGCTSGNCHSVATATGSWAKKGLIPGLTAADTSTFTLIRTSGLTYYTTLTNTVLRNQVWNAYKDSVRRFYLDTLANASWRPYKTFSTPVVLSSVRGSLSSYDDILLDIWYPKSIRSLGTVTYISSDGSKFYVRGNPLNATSSLITRIDSTLLLANPATGVFASSHQGDMAYGDGGINASEIALIKAWYFTDPNIPAVWKYGINNAGIFKYRKSGNIIKSK